MPMVQKTAMTMERTISVRLGDIGILHRSWRAAPLNGRDGIAVVAQSRLMRAGRCDGDHRIAEWVTPDGRWAAQVCLTGCASFVNALCLAFARLPLMELL